MEIDQHYLAEAGKVLGTASAPETINAALRHVVERRDEEIVRSRPDILADVAASRERAARGEPGARRRLRRRITDL